MQFVPGKMMKKQQSNKRPRPKDSLQYLKYTEEDQRWKSNM